jgi:hypothetical protein
VWGGARAGVEHGVWAVWPPLKRTMVSKDLQSRDNNIVGKRHADGMVWCHRGDLAG